MDRMTAIILGMETVLGHNWGVGGCPSPLIHVSGELTHMAVLLLLKDSTATTQIRLGLELFPLYFILEKK